MAQGFYNVTDKIKEELLKDKFVKTVTYGNIFDVDLKKREMYPLSHMIVNNTTDTGQTLIFNLSIIFMDIVDINKDENIDGFVGNDNEQDVLNTQLAVANKLTAVLRRGTLAKELYKLQGDVQLEPFVDRFNDKVAGWTATFSVVTHNKMTAC